MQNVGMPFVPTADPRLRYFVDLKLYAHVHVQVLHMHEFVWWSHHACIPDRSLMSANVSQRISERERCCCCYHHHGGMTLFVTVVMDSVSLRGTCASAVSERLSLCFTLTHTLTRTNTVL